MLFSHLTKSHKGSGHFADTDGSVQTLLWNPDLETTPGGSIHWVTVADAGQTPQNALPWKWGVHFFLIYRWILQAEGHKCVFWKQGLLPVKSTVCLIQVVTSQELKTGILASF